MGDVLSRNVTKPPEKARADDLSLHGMISQAVLVPFPQPQHYLSLYFEREKEFGQMGEKFREIGTKFERENKDFENPCPIFMIFLSEERCLTMNLISFPWFRKLVWPWDVCFGQVLQIERRRNIAFFAFHPKWMTLLK